VSLRLVPELTLGGLRAIESKLGRVVIGQVGSKAFLDIRPPHSPALDTAWDRSQLLDVHGAESKTPRFTTQSPKRTGSRLTGHVGAGQLDSADKLLLPLRHWPAPASVEIEPGRRPNLSLGTGLGPDRPQNLDASSRLHKRPKTRIENGRPTQSAQGASRPNRAH